MHSVPKYETSDVTTYVTCIASLTEAGGGGGGCAENAKSKYFSESELFWYQNVPLVLTKKMPTYT